MASFRCAFLVSLAISLTNVYIEAAKRNEKENNQQDDTYTTSWVVEITNGGKQMADAVADEYGFKNLGKLKVYHYSNDILCVCMHVAISIFIKISAEREFYHFELSEIEQSCKPKTLRRVDRKCCMVYTL